jgi:hypothetical protein
MKGKLFLGLSAVLLIAVFTVSGFGQGVTPADVCTTLGSASIPDAVLGVASNFSDASIDLINEFQGTGKPGAGTTIQICQNSTANLETQLLANRNKYNMLYAADTSADTYGIDNSDNPYYDANTEYVSFTYSHGVPVIFAEYDATAMPNAGSLINGLSSADAASLVGTVTAASLYPTYSVASGLTTANSQDVTVAGTGAPYGRAAHLILNNMGNYTAQCTSPNYCLPGVPPNDTPYNLPTWIYPTLWGNIDLTKQAVLQNTVSVNGTPYDTSDVNAGWISKAQICSGIAPNDTTPDYVYVQFLNSTYILTQNAALTTPNSVAKDLYDYIDYKMSLPATDSNSWAKFLDNHCYN